MCVQEGDLKSEMEQRGQSSLSKLQGPCPAANATASVSSGQRSAVVVRLLLNLLSKFAIDQVSWAARKRVTKVTVRSTEQTRAGPAKRVSKPSSQQSRIVANESIACLSLSSDSAGPMFLMLLLMMMILMRLLVAVRWRPWTASCSHI